METVKQTSDKYNPLFKTIDAKYNSNTGEAIFSAQARRKGGKDSFCAKTGDEGLNQFACLLVHLLNALYSLQRVFALDLGNISKRKL